MKSFGCDWSFVRGLDFRSGLQCSEGLSLEFEFLMHKADDAC